MPADPDTAASLLARGDKALAYPGGARRWTGRHAISDGHVGYAKLAVRCGVPARAR